MDIRDRLQTTLSKLAPIETAQLTSRPRLRFCWTFFRPDVGTLDRLRAAVESFKGQRFWGLRSSQEGLCLAQAQLPEIPVEPGGSAEQNPYRPHEDLMKPPVAEVDNLCHHLEVTLGLSNVSPKQFHHRLLTRFVLEQSWRELRDFIEPGEQTIWLVTRAADFDDSRAHDSPAQRRLHFGVTYSEWHAILFNVLRVDKNTYRDWLMTTRVHPADTPPLQKDYPMLSRIADPFTDEIVESPEVPTLLSEVSTLFNSTNDENALRGLDKLARASLLAINSKRAIYFASK